MPPQGRVGDKGLVPVDAHGCVACPHPSALGPGITGSVTVLTNRLPSLRVDDLGVHAACCGTNMWTAAKGSASVFIDGKPAHRVGDEQKHCGGTGFLLEGSPNVIIDGASTGSGAGAGAAGGAAGGKAGRVPGGGGAGPGPAPVAPVGPAPAPDEPDEPDEPAVDDDELEVLVVDASGAAIAGERYELVLPDGALLAGVTDAAGRIFHDQLTQRGTCTLRLPDRDGAT